MKAKTKLFSLLLAVCLMLSVMPMAALADEEAPENIAAEDAIDDIDNEQDEEIAAQPAETVAVTEENSAVTEENTPQPEEVIENDAAPAEDLIEAEIERASLPEALAEIDANGVTATANSDGTFKDANGIRYQKTSDTTVSVISNTDNPDSFVSEDEKIGGGLPTYSGEITIPAQITVDSTTYSVTAIKMQAFRDSSITKVSVPSTVTAIGERAFYQCSSLTEVDLQKGLISIGANAFENCSALSTLTIPSTVTSIGSAAFGACKSLTSLHIPAGVTNGLVKALVGNTLYPYLENVTIEEGSPYDIEGGVLYKDTVAQLYMGPDEDVVLREGTTELASQETGEFGLSGRVGVFGSCSVKSVDLSKTTIMSIPKNTFYGASNLVSVTFPESITEIGYSAFYGCSSLETVTIPEGVTTIEEQAFYGCTGLTMAMIPASAENIGKDVFSYGALSDGGSILIFLGETPPTVDTRLWAKNYIPQSGNLTVVVPTGSEKVYSEMKVANNTTLAVYLTDGEGNLLDDCDFSLAMMDSIVCPEKVGQISMTSEVPTVAALNITSSDTAIATVDEMGTVTGVAAGEATITASITVNGFTLVSDSCTVTVSHSYGATWESDGTGHWHVCSECGGKSDVTAHTYGEWKETKAATETEKGEKQRTCSVCGYVDTAEIPTLGHTYGTEWKSDETNHWHECACGDKADVAAHTYGEWKVTKEATETEKGAKERTCSVCGYKETAEIPVVVVDIETQIVQNPLTDVPEELKATEFNTVEAITEELIRVAVTNAGYTAENTVVSDVKLQISTDGGKNWVDATEENFPAEGITVTLDYPTGTGKDTHDFVVTHMFAVTSAKLNTKAGDTETPAVTKTDKGIVVTLKGLSPVSISWKEVEKAPAPTESPAASDAPTATPAPTPKAPPTGDSANIGLWAALLAVCALGAGAVLVYGRKRQSR